jgi:hypothetical protein
MPRKNLLSLHEAIVVALINQPGRIASFQQIADFIEKRNLYPERKGNIPLATQVMLRSTKAKGAYRHLFEDIGAGFIRLRNNIGPMEIWKPLAALLQHERQFFNPDAKELNVVDNSFGTKQNKKIKISPADIICICSVNKSRVKKIYTKQHNTTGKEEVVCYQFNSNLYNFETLCQYLDSINHHLIMVSKSAIVNVGCYKLNRAKELTPVPSFTRFKIPSPILITSQEHLDNFKKVQDAYTRNILLQKVAIGYKNEMGI